MHADIVNRKNVRVVQSTGGFRFLLKSPQSISILRESCRQYFDCHVAVQPFITRAKHLAHPAFADLRAVFIATETSARRNRCTHLLTFLKVLAAAGKEPVFREPTQMERQL